MSLKLIGKVFDQAIIVYKRVPLQDGRGFTSERDGRLVGDLEVFVDAELLSRAIGSKALRSKRHITKLQNGAVMIQAVNTRHEKGE